VQQSHKESWDLPFKANRKGLVGRREKHHACNRGRRERGPQERVFMGGKQETKVIIARPVGKERIIRGNAETPLDQDRLPRQDTHRVIIMTPEKNEPWENRGGG